MVRALVKTGILVRGKVGTITWPVCLLRKVPATADAAASPTHVAGTVCKAGDPCSVCHSDFEAEGQVVQLPCEHCFHERCILPWLEMHHTCPNCRADLPSEAPPRPSSRYPGAPEDPDVGSNTHQRIWELMQEQGMVRHCLFIFALS